MWSLLRRSKKEKIFRSRAPRVRLNPLVHARFHRLTPIPPGEMQLSNVSTSGLALFSQSKEDRQPAGTRITGNLMLGSTTGAMVQLEVVRVDGSTLGCRFIDPSPDLRKTIARYFKVEIASGELLPVPTSQLSQEEDGQPIWYTGENGCELYLVVANQRIVRFHLSFFGNYLEGGEQQPLRFGKIVEDPIRDKPGHKGSALIRSESSWSEELMASASRLVHQASKLEPVYREKLKELITLEVASK